MTGLLFVLPVLLLTGCTAMLWDKNTFARHCHPADPPNLALYYSSEHQDLLVQYDEAREHDKKIHRRSYWLDANVERVRRGGMPQFVSSRLTYGLENVPRLEARCLPPPEGLHGLYAVASATNDWFTLYDLDKQLESYGLPKYSLASGTGKKILLTPVAMAGDAALVGAFVGLAGAASWDGEIPETQHRKPKPSAK